MSKIKSWILILAAILFVVFLVLSLQGRVGYIIPMILCVVAMLWSGQDLDKAWQQWKKEVQEELDDFLKGK